MAYAFMYVYPTDQTTLVTITLKVRWRDRCQNDTIDCRSESIGRTPVCVCPIFASI